MILVSVRIVMGWMKHMEYMEHKIECGVCGIVLPSDANRAITTCKHAFCISCLKSWNSIWKKKLRNAQNHYRNNPDLTYTGFIQLRIIPKEDFVIIDVGTADNYILELSDTARAFRYLPT